MLARPEGENTANPYLLGEVTSQVLMAPEQFGIDPSLAPASITSVGIRDPYVEQWSPEDRLEVSTEEAKADSHARERRLEGWWERQPRTAYYDDQGQLLGNGKKRGWGDPVSRDVFFKTLDSPSSVAWRNLIPSAAALGYLSDPNKFNFIVKKGKPVAEIDDTTRKWLSLCTDAVGIRGRGTVMADLVAEFANYPQNRDEELRWLSVACGTALPAMQGSIRAGIAPELILADFDDDAMSITNGLAKDIGFKGTIDKEHVDIFNTDVMAEFSTYLEESGGKPKLIDAMGIFEYTGENLGVDSVKFIKSLYEMLAPGGRLVFGQMRSDRPNPDFTMGVISWPYVEMRSPRQFMEVITDAGIAPNDCKLYLPSDNMYTIGAIDKPLN